MGKKRRSYNKRAHREVANSFSSRWLVEPIKYSDLRHIEDRRRFTPSARNAASFTSARHRLIEIGSKKRSMSPITRANLNFKPLSVGKITFEDPNTVICVRRKVRKEVLHATKKTGKRGQKAKRFNYFSDVACRKKR